MSESDDSTIAFYDAEAHTYADAFKDERDTRFLERFMAEVCEGGSVCDLGSGNGWAAAEMRDAGFDVTAIDGSAGLAAEARARHGLDVQVMKFEDYAFVDTFDGVWAAWSLHHARRETFPELLERIGKSIRSNGILFLAVKGGTGEKRDKLDRLYSYYEMHELHRLVDEFVGGTVQFSETFSGPGFDGSVSPLHALIVRKPT